MVQNVRECNSTIIVEEMVSKSSPVGTDVDRQAVIFIKRLRAVRFPIWKFYVSCSRHLHTYLKPHRLLVARTSQ